MAAGERHAWTLEDPVYAGGAFGQLEVPQVFEAGGRWYCLFCTAPEHYSRAYAAGYPGRPVRGTHYLTAEGPRGPWTVAPGPFLDGDPAVDDLPGSGPPNGGIDALNGG